MLREEKGKNTARLSLSLLRDGKTYRLVLKNVSDVDATEVELHPILQRAEDNPIIESDYSSKFPVKKLSPGSEVRLIAAVYLGSPSAFNFRVTWKNPDGKPGEDECFVSL